MINQTKKWSNELQTEWKQKTKSHETKRIGSKWSRSKQNDLYKYWIRTGNTSAWWQWMQLTITIAMCLHSALLYEWMLIHLRVHTRTGWTELWWTVGLSMPCDAMRWECDAMRYAMRCDVMGWLWSGHIPHWTQLAMYAHRMVAAEWLQPRWFDCSGTLRE